MFQEVLDHGGFLGEDEWEKLLLLSWNQKGDELAKVAGENWVQLLISLDEVEKSLQKYVFVFLDFILDLDLSLEGAHTGVGGEFRCLDWSGSLLGLILFLHLSFLSSFDLLRNFFLLWFSLSLLRVGRFLDLFIFFVDFLRFWLLSVLCLSWSLSDWSFFLLLLIFWRLWLSLGLGLFNRDFFYLFGLSLLLWCFISSTLFGGSFGFFFFLVAFWVLVFLFLILGVLSRSNWLWLVLWWRFEEFI